MLKKVGKFIYDGEHIAGPAEYMKEQGSEHLDNLLAGKVTSFNMSMHYSPDTVTAILVAMQTNYAGWRGSRELMKCLNRK